MRKQQRLIKLFSLLNSSRKYNRKNLLFSIKQIEGEETYSNATLTRDLKSLKDIGMVINNNKFYEIDYLSSQEGIKFFQTLEFFQFTELLNKGNNISPLFDYTNRVEDLGLDNLTEIINAIRDKKELLINYLNFDGIGQDNWLVRPLFLREYDSRWYLVVENETQRGNTLSLNRIKELKIVNRTFKPSGKITIRNFYNCIGCNTKGQIENVRLWVSPYQMNYFKNQKFHRTQRIIEENQSGSIIEIDVYTNFELLQHILKYGHRLKVLEPLSLALVVKKELQKAINHYN